MSKGGSKPSKPEMSKSEKVQHATSAAEWDHYKDTYVPIEKKYLKDSQKDFGDRGRAQSSSSVMRNGTDNLRLSALSGGTSDAGSVVGSAVTSSNVAATSSAQQERDSRMAGALGVGREIATDTNRSLGSLSSTGARGAISEMQNKLKVDTARDKAVAQALGSVAGSATAAYVGRGKTAPTATPSSTNSLYTNAGLNRSATQMQGQWAPPPSARR